MITIILAVGAGASLLAGVLSLLPIAHGIARIWDFPRLQILAACAVLLALTLLAVEAPGWRLGIAATIGAAGLIQVARILPYTPLWRAQSKRCGKAQDHRSLTILASNVKMSNRDYHRLLATVDEHDPDILLLMETDRRWLEAVAGLKARYPHCVLEPRENTYGMALYSRLLLSETVVRELCLDDVPSITTTVTLPDGDRIRLFAVHPEPPVPYADTLPRDAEIVLVAQMAARERLPVVVTGDLNDVAWSRTTRRFQNLSGLLDPRKGRGFYNSFHADYWFARWPLDHLFHSPHFRLGALHRLPSIGSDHFPMLFQLALHQVSKARTAPRSASKGEKEEAAALVRGAKKLDRDPVGADWEKD